MSNSSDRQSKADSVQVSLEEIWRVERQRIEQEAEAQREKIAAEALRQAAEQRERERVAAEGIATEQQRLEAEAREQRALERQRHQLQIEAERRARVEAELKIEERRVAAEFAQRAPTRARLVIACALAGLLVVGGAAFYFVSQQAQKRAALDAELVAMDKRTGDELRRARQRFQRTRDTIRRLRGQVATLQQPPPLVRSIVPTAKKKKIRKKAKSTPGKATLRTDCPDNDPLCGIVEGNPFRRRKKASF